MESLVLPRSSPGHRIHDAGLRCRVRKGATLLAYLAAFLFVAVVYRERLGGFTVAFGVAGAGIAFALQEVIASVAGWLALSFGGFYEPGDRIQLGGIRGNVIDIGILRTTLMECGQWVNGDLYNGRIVRIANSFVFKEPVFHYSGDFRSCGTSSWCRSNTGAVFAALGGVLVPAAIYLALQSGGPGQRGWAIPMATDIAFVVGC